jgi:ubiquinone/menaquinone biosynthesis C-methylase UbiE
MEHRKGISPKEISEPEPSYFALQAYWGVTKHMGGLKATEELVELCHIDKGKYVLEVGCGIGVTACYLAKRHGCRVVGIDISEGMIDWSKRRARRAGVEDRVEFIIADAQNLPFEDALFDAVICESVTAFVDKQRTISGYIRVTKPGGYVGLNEATWVRAAPLEAVEYLSHAVGKAEFLTSDGWKALLEGSGFTDVVVRIYKVNAISQWINEMRQIDSPVEYLRAWKKFLSLYIKSSAVRKYVKELWPPPRSIFKIFEYFGYGIYVGRK